MRIDWAKLRNIELKNVFNCYMNFGMLTAMTSNEEHRETIQRLLLDTRRQLSNAPDRDIFALLHCQTDQVISPARLLEVMS